MNLCLIAIRPWTANEQEIAWAVGLLHAVTHSHSETEKSGECGGRIYLISYKTP